MYKGRILDENYALELVSTCADDLERQRRAINYLEKGNLTFEAFLVLLPFVDVGDACAPLYERRAEQLCGNSKERWGAVFSKTRRYTSLRLVSRVRTLELECAGMEDQRRNVLLVDVKMVRAYSLLAKMVEETHGARHRLVRTFHDRVEESRLKNAA